jgi:Dehydratase family
MTIDRYRKKREEMVMADNKNSARRKTAAELRSARWFAPDDLRTFGHLSRLMQMGYAKEEWAGRPVIAILNTWSDAQPCHSHFKSRIDDVKRGILMAGGFPMELPALSLSETFLSRPRCFIVICSRWTPKNYYGLIQSTASF